MIDPPAEPRVNIHSLSYKLHNMAAGELTLLIKLIPLPTAGEGECLQFHHVVALNVNGVARLLLRIGIVDDAQAAIVG